MAERLYILDAHSLIYQVFHAIPEMTGPNGMPTNAVFGFVRDITFLRREKRPDYLLCAFDSPGLTFRHDLAADYKATRSEMPDDLRPQIEMIRRILVAFRIPILAAPGMEADDFLASVGAQAAQRKIQAYLCTADKDVRQVVGDYVSILDLRRNRIIDREYVQKDWGVSPEQVVDYQAMVGDSVDNIKGIVGVGPKTASQLLQKYGTLESILEHADEIPGKKARENILKGKQSVLVSRDLVRLRTDLPTPADWSEWRLATPDYPALLELFSECGFHGFVDEIRREMPSVDTWTADYALVRDAAQLESMLADLAERPRIGFSVVTDAPLPMNGNVVGYGFAAAEGKAYYVAVRAPFGETTLDPSETAEKLRPLLEDPSVQKVGHNLKFDWIVLENLGIRLQGISFDSVVAGYLLDPGERNHELGQLSHRLLGHETVDLVSLVGKGKKQVRLDEVPAADMCSYGAERADVGLRLAAILESKLAKEGLGELYGTLEAPLIEVLATMEQAGIKVDVDLLKRLSAEFEGRLVELEQAIVGAAGKPFNFDSPTQLRQILFEDLCLPVIKRTKTGPSTDQEVLEELADRHPVCALLIERRKLAKLKSTYIDALPGLIHPCTGRIHATFNQTVAATGRLSSSDPNLQNIPIRTEDGRQIRQAFLPGSSEQLLLSADYSQIELRMLAHYSGDANLRRAFQEDQDIHAVVAARIAGVGVDEVSSEMRSRAKAVNFGIMYGLSPYGLAKQLKIDQEEAAAFINAYFDQYPGIEAFFTEVLEGAKKDRFVRTILGRRRPISGIRNTTGRVRNLPERTAINAVIQGSAADLIKKAMIDIHRMLRTSHWDAKMLLQIHDELVFEVRRDQTEAFGRQVVDAMAEALELSVPLKVDAGIGENWLDTEPLSALGSTAA